MNYQNSPGFMYYTLDEKEESSDYLSLNDSSSLNDSYTTKPHFSPSTTNTSQDYNRKSPRFYNNNNRRGRRHQNFNNYSRTPNSNFRRNYAGSSFLNKSQENGYSKYIHPSFTENPWRYLEQSSELKSEKQEAEDNIIKDNS
nr:dr1-associated corepressor homolog [Onthophagus taurus]